MNRRPACSWRNHDRIDQDSSDCSSQRLQPAFSLLEVIIATAVLAGSAIVLFSMLSLGSKFGELAQQRTVALATASSLLEELIATNRIDPTATELTGLAGSQTTWGYRVRVSPYGMGSQNATDAVARLQQITIELFASEVGRQSDQRPICSLSRIVRVRARENDSQSLNSAPLSGNPNGS